MTKPRVCGNRVSNKPCRDKTRFCRDKVSNKLCRDKTRFCCDTSIDKAFLRRKPDFVATELLTNSVTTKSDFVATKPGFVAIELKTKRKAFFLNPENCCFGLFSSPFHPRTINTHILGF